MSQSKLDKILAECEVPCDACYHGTDFDADKAKQQIKDLMLELIGEDNEHRKDMPVPDPDPFALPQDHQNQLRRYLRQKVSEL